jgi:hypothetical protein
MQSVERAGDEIHGAGTLLDSLGHGRVCITRLLPATAVTRLPASVRARFAAKLPPRRRLLWGAVRLQIASGFLAFRGLFSWPCRQAASASGGST